MLNVGIVSLLLAIVLFMLGGRPMQLAFISQDVIAGINSVIGYGLLLFLIIMAALGRIRFFEKYNSIDKDELKRIIQDTVIETVKQINAK
jgi:hypothetical protein